MYSVVLFMAMTGGADATAFGHRCNGCSCSGYVSSCSGCFGGHGCRGCHGCSGCHGGLFGGHRSRCHGCSGCSCSGFISSCHGGHGCSGCNGCNGGHRLFGHRNRCSGCNGCHGYVSNCCGAVVTCTGCTGGVIVPGTAPATTPVPTEKKKMPEAPAKGAQVNAPATIIVTLPADAKVTIDGNATTSTSARRVFVTPALETNAEYSYSIQVELVQDGQNVIQTKNITVRGGQTTEVPFEFAQAVASR